MVRIFQHDRKIENLLVCDDNPVAQQFSAQ